MATALTLSVGSAASLGGLSEVRLGAGDIPVLACDTDGVTASFTVVAGLVTAVVVGGLADPTCDGAAVQVTLAGASGVALASAGPLTVAADADLLDSTVTLPVAAPPTATSVQSTFVLAVGP